MRNIFIIIFSLPFMGFGQELGWKKYDVKEGLVQTQVLCVFQDSKGFLWIGTKGGVSRFNGYEFKNFTVNDGLPSSIISDIKEDAAGNIWLLSSKGLCKLENNANTFKKLQLTVFELEKNTILEFQAKFLFNRDGSIFIFRNVMGSHIFKNGRYIKLEQIFPELKSKSFYFAIYQNKTRAMWLGTYYNELFCIENNRVKRIYDNGFKIKFLWDKHDTIFALTESGSILKYDGHCFNEIFHLNINFKNVHIYHQDKFLNFNINNVLVQFDLETFEIKYSKGNLNKFGFVDNEKNLWTFGEYGLHKLISPAFLNFTPENSEIKHHVTSIVEDNQKNIWFAIADINNGLIKYNGKGYQFQNEYQQITSRKITSFEYGSIKDAKGNLLFSSYSGLLIYDGNKFNLDKKLSDIEIFCIYEDTLNKKFLIGRNPGVLVIKRYNGDTITYNKNNGNKLPNVLSITQDKFGKYWLCHTTMIAVFDGTKFNYFTEKELNGMKGASAIFRDYKGNLWFGCPDGIWFYDYTRFYKIAKNTLNSVVNSIAGIDNTGILACSTNLIAIINLQKFYSKPGYLIEGDNLVQIFDESNGFLGGECEQNDLLRDSKGNFWIGTMDRVVYFEPHKLIKNTFEPVIQIAKIQFLNNQMKWIDFTESTDSVKIELDALKINHSQNNLRFDFFAISFTNPARIKYQYKLKGYDKGWSDVTTERYATYTNLPYGNYQFQVKACNSDGIWGQKPCILKFIIVPAWWQTWWFKIIAPLVFIGLLMLFVLYYQRRKFQSRLKLVQTKVATQEEERKRIGKEIHDGIAGGMKAIGLELYAFNVKNGNDQIREIAKQLHSLEVETRTLSHTLLAPAFVNSNLEAELQSYIVRIIHASGINIRFNCLNDKGWGNINKEIQQHLYRISQEILHNIIKHAKAKNVTVQIMVHPEKITYLAEDNGIGFDINSANEGKGIENIRQRVGLMNGDISIESSSGGGTAIIINVPV